MKKIKNMNFDATKTHLAILQEKGGITSPTMPEASHGNRSLGTKEQYIWRINNVLRTVKSDKYLRRLYYAVKDYVTYEEMYGESEF